ncbi:hypothetical protein AOCH_005810 [Aspergillus ochraceoroseus]|uniref:UBC core domain-containing protein n=1 Tax=Aspergillus ochraceoroseus TaxID=138278 RepID=A0A0F8WT46_9EURO|nr:hypothetical protein AOCH_005810 [Aspergillus ochraceoroseus]
MGVVLANYEMDSGLRWNRVTPALNLLRHAGYEAQQPRCDARLVRVLYLNAVTYLLTALPEDLTSEEAATLRRSLPEKVKASLPVSSGSGVASPQSPRTPSYLHRLLASSIVCFCLLLQFLMPFVKMLLVHLYQYERSYRVTERVTAMALSVADHISKGSVTFGSTVVNMYDGQPGVAAAVSAASCHAAPPGVYVTLNPSDPTFWACVIFVRSGPYASAVLRFQIRFPPSYPDRPPLVIFSTDMFHPLIVPLTTYTFSTGVSNEDPVSATDEERLPPGGFSLRHGFPHWFGRARRSAIGSVTSSRAVSLHCANTGAMDATTSKDDSQQQKTIESVLREGDRSEVQTPPPAEPIPEMRSSIPVLEILNYIRTSFDDESVLDSVPLEAAGNPSAWHAWKAHRKDSTPAGLASSSKRSSPQARLPGDWHWDGIWARRVQYEIEASQSDSTLFGNTARGGLDEMVAIRFAQLDPSTLASVKEMIIPPVEPALE